MLRNVFLKRAFKSIVSPILTLVNQVVPKDDKTVLLYSANGGICHSLIPLRKVLLDNGFDKKYQIYCGIESLRYADNEQRVTYLPQLRAYLKFFRAQHVFYTVGVVPIKPSRKQSVIQLGHGVTDYKTWGKWSKIGNGDEVFFSHIAVSSDLYVPIYAAETGCKENMVVPIGDVLADQLLKNSRKKTVFAEYDKLLVWLPTFRKSDYLGYDDSTMERLVPIFDEEDYPVINEYLKKYNIKLVIKTHPMQNNAGEGQRHFSHLDVYTHQEFMDNGYELYPLFAQADGMIGDYSSVSIHALLIDIPLGFVIPDIENYGNIRGFVFKDPTEYMCGNLIKSKEEFYLFIDDFAAGKDKFKDKRRRVKDIMFKYQDGRTCERAIELSGMTI